MPITRSITITVAAALALGCSTIAEAPDPTTDGLEPGQSTSDGTGESSTDSESGDVDGNTWPLDVPDGGWTQTDSEVTEADGFEESNATETNGPEDPVETTDSTEGY